MSQQIEHYLVIDTDQYSGNFEREMAGFVFGGYGYADTENYRWESYQEHWTDEEREAVKLFGGSDELEGILTPQVHDEYGLVMVQIVQTPRDLLPESEKSHGYCSLQVQIEPECWDQVTPDVIEAIKERCERFCSLYTPLGRGNNSMHFKGLRHVTRTITEASTTLSL